MVKADARHDYYADLELPPAATAEEIRKQFHKLALKYHPDRNPGKEAEYNPKFQAIQAANEILIDPTQRAKYDTDRLRNGTFYPYTSPTRPNVPPRSPANNFPPPPPRPPPPTAAKTSHPVPSSGTNRYSQYAKAEAPSGRTNAEDNQTKANAFKAWEQMKHGTGPPPTSRVPPRPTRTTFPARPMPNGTSDDSTPPRRTAYEQFQESQGTPRMSRANTTRAPKKVPFPAGTFTGEETSAPKKPHFNDIPHAERPPRGNPNFPMPPAPGHRKPDPLPPFKPHTGPDGHFTKSERISTPYASLGGERTYFSSHGLQRPPTGERRASAERYDTDPTSRDASQVRPASSTPMDRQHHSASPKTRTPKQRVPLSSSSSSTSSSDDTRKFTQRPFGTRRKPLRKPNEGQRRPTLRPSVKVDPAPDVESAMPGHSGLRKSWLDGERNPQVPEGTKTDLPEGFLQHRLKRESLRIDPNRRRGSDIEGPASTTQPEHPLQRPKSWHENYGPPKNGQNPRSSSRTQTESRTEKEPMYGNPGLVPSPSTPSRNWSEDWPLMSNQTPKTFLERFSYYTIPSILLPTGQLKQETLGKHAPSQLTNPTINDMLFENADLTHNYSFKFPTYDAKTSFDAKPPLKTRSSESINTNFSPSHWNRQFTSGKGNCVPPPSTKRDVPDGTSTSQARPMPPPPPPRQDGTQISSSAPTTSIPQSSAQDQPLPNHVNISTEEWAQHFKPPSWDYPQAPKSSSPVRSTNRKRPMQPLKASRAPSKRPPAASVSTAAEKAGNGPGPASAQSSSSRTSGDESAMDIDPVLTPPSGPSSGEQRSSAQSNRTTKGGRPPSSGPSVPPRANGQAAADAGPIYVSDLKNVAPFAPSAEGLKDLNDLTTTLPFESQSSTRSTVLRPQLLKLPDPPKAPMSPPQCSWGYYIGQMKVYMLEWNEYNSKMLAHFTERQSNTGNTLNGDWMSSQGDQGYQQYMQGVEEDFRVRAHWDVSWEKHRECMKGLGSVREKFHPRQG